MKIVDVNGRLVNWSLRGYSVRADDSRPRSSYHLRARGVLASTFPTDMVLEEVDVPGSRMKLDFYLPSRMLAVEVQGQQHSKPSSFMHGDLRGFGRAVARDKKKRDFCESNDITLIHLECDETDEQWRSKLLDAGL